MKKLFSFLFLLFFTMLYAANVGVGTPQPTNVLPILVEGGEPFENRDDFYIPSRSPVNAVAISRDGKTIVSGSDDGSIKILDSSTGELKRILEGHTERVTSVSISKDGKTIVSSSSDNSIKIWDKGTGELKRSLEGHTSTVNSVTISKDGKTIVSGSGDMWSNDNSIKIWDRDTGELKRSLEGHKSIVTSVAISKDGKTILSSSSDKSVKIWDKGTGELIRSLEGHKDSVSSVAISEDGKTIVSGSDDGSIIIWDSSTGSLLRTLNNIFGSTSFLLFSTDSKSIISCGAYPSIMVWDVSTGKLLKALKGHTTEVISFAISSDGKTIVSGSWDGSIKVWDITTGMELKSLEGHKSSISATGISPNGENIIIGSDNGYITIWDTSIDKIVKHFKGHDKRVTSVSYNGTDIISSSWDNHIMKIWDTFNDIEEINIESKNDDFIALAFNSTSKSIAVVQNRGPIRFKDLKTDKALKNLKGYSSLAPSEPITKDGKFLIFSKAESIHIMDINTSKEIQLLSDISSVSTGYISSVSISNNGKIIVSGSWDGTLKVWDRNTGKVLKTLTGHKSNVTSVNVNYNKKIIVSSSSDGIVKLWNLDTGKLQKELVLGRNGCWAIFDYEKNNILRGDDGTLLYHRNGANLKLALPKLPKEDKVHLNTKGASVVNDQSKSFLIHVMNVNNEKLYWIKNAYYSDEYCHLLENRTSNIEAHENGDLNLSIDVTLPKLNPKPINNHNIKLKFSTATGSEFNLSVPISIRYADINITKAEVSKDGKNLNIEIKNIGNEPLKNAKVKLTKPFVADIQDLSELNASATQAFSYVLPLDENKKPIELNEKDVLNVTVFIPNVKLEKENPEAEVAPAYTWQRNNVPIILNKLAWYVYALWALGILLFLGLILYFKVFKNPLVIELSETPNKLKALNGTQLKEASFKLKLINRLKTTLDLADVSEANFNNAIKFFKSNTDEKAERFAKQIGAVRCEKKGEFYQITLAEDFNLNSMKKFLFYVSDETAKKIKHKIVNLNDKVFVIANETEQNAVAKLAKDKTNRVIAPTVSALTELMLSAEAQEKFVTVLSDCLSFKDVSPYQLNGDVKSEKNFFGRIDILREIISNDNSTNYLLVGARKLGKSSIFKALERRYESNEQVVCYNITLTESGDVLIAMAEVLGLSSDAGLEAITTAIKKQTQKPIFLIDEADMFVKNEKENGYLITSVFRKLSQEGDAMFILAGFWTLYEYVTLDYQSPLKNFGKLISLGGLEEEACRALMVEPMEGIRVSYEQDEIVDEVVALCGQRANYIATICDVMLRDLKTSTISHEAMQNALESEETDRMLKGSGQLSASEEANRLDRLIVYLTIEQESFRLGDVVEGLKAKALKIDIERVNESLDRLVLGYVVGKHKGNYHYKIPLLKERLIEDDLEFLIEGEVLELG